MHIRDSGFSRSGITKMSHIYFTGKRQSSFGIRCRTLRHEGVAGRHRNKQAQLHSFSGSCRSLASRRNTPPSTPGNQQGKHGIHTAPHGREPLASTVHSFVLQHQPDQNTVTAHHRAGMGIPILRRRCFRQPTEI